MPHVPHVPHVQTPRVQTRTSMRAIVASGSTACLRTDLGVPRARGSDVVVDVQAVGLCRTDLYAVTGRIAARDPVIPGHEFSGVAAAVGPDVTAVRVGHHVTVNPVLPCGDCDRCRRDDSQHCGGSKFLGVDCDGACAEYVCVPESAVVRIPEGMSFLTAAFSEPVAASLAVLEAGIRLDQHGLVFGNNRIAELTRRVLRSAGYEDVTCCDPAAGRDLRENEFDFIVETVATTETLAEMLRLVRPRGRIVLKSRQYEPVQLILRDILVKEPVFEAVNYGRFEQAVELLATGALRVDDLIGECFSLERFDEAFAAGLRDEQRKTFLIPQELR